MTNHMNVSGPKMRGKGRYVLQDEKRTGRHNGCISRSWAVSSIAPHNMPLDNIYTETFNESDNDGFMRCGINSTIVFFHPSCLELVR